MLIDSIKKYYLRKIKLIKKYNQLYYDKNESRISDSDFDKINGCVLGLGLNLRSKENKNKWQCLVYEK